MPVKRRKPKTRRAEIPHWQIDFLLTGERPADESDVNPFTVLKFCHLIRGNAPAEDLWREIGAELVKEWVAARPGTRPFAWWIWTAPPQPPAMRPLRARVGGGGDCQNNFGCTMWFGIPASSWYTNWLIDYYNWVGRAPADRGPWEADNGPGHCKAQKFDPQDPPRFESQAAYLKRLGLLLRGEASRLTARDLQPQILPKAYWPKG